MPCLNAQSQKRKKKEFVIVGDDGETKVPHASIGLTRMTLSPTATQLFGMFVARWNCVYTLAAIMY